MTCVYLYDGDLLRGNLLAHSLGDLAAHALVLDRLHDAAPVLRLVPALGCVDVPWVVEDLGLALLVRDLAALLLDDGGGLGVVDDAADVLALLLVDGGALLLELADVLHGALGVGDGPAVGLGHGATLLLCHGAALLLCHGLVP